MFDGEMKSLEAITATKTVRVPQPILVVDNPDGGAVLVMEYIDMRTLRASSQQMGNDLARYKIKFYRMAPHL
jgi:protein-ribulosamine 3-kinase